MLERVTMYKTVDGQLFKYQTDALNHTKNNIKPKLFKDKLKKLVDDQIEDKRLLRTTTWRRIRDAKEVIPRLQRNIIERKFKINKLQDEIRLLKNHGVNFNARGRR